MRRPPQLVQVARHRAGRVQHDRIRPGEFVDHPDQFALAGPRRQPDVVDALHFRIPRLVQPLRLGPIGRLHGIAGQQFPELIQRLSGVAHDGQAVVFAGVELGHVDVDEADTRVLPGSLGGGREIAVAGADADDQIGVPGDAVGRQRACDADRAEIQRMIPAQAALAGHRLAHRNAGRVDELPQGFRGIRVDHAAAGYDHGVLAGADHLRGSPQGCSIGAIAHNVPDAPAKQFDRVVVSLGLHVLGQCQCDRAGLRRAGQHAHCLRQSRQQLVGPVNAIPILADRLEAVVDRQVLAVRRFELLQDGRHIAAGEDIAGQQQHRQAVDGRRGRAGDHVGGAGADRGEAGEGLKAVLDLGIGRGRMDCALLVAYLVVAKVGVLDQRFAHAGHAAVAKNSKAAGEERRFNAIAFHILILEKPDEGLRHSQADGLRLGHRIQLLGELAIGNCQFTIHN